MELIILALVELITVVLVPAITLAINLIALAMELLFLILEIIITGVLEARKKKPIEVPQESPQAAEEPTKSIETPLVASQEITEKPKRKKTVYHKIAAWGAVVCSVLLLLFLLTAVIANAFFFESVLRFALRHVESRTKITVTFDNANGNFWTGKIHMNGVTAKRQDHPVSRFDLKGESVDLDLSVSQLLRWSFMFESVQVSKFDGTWEQVGKADKLKPRRNFQIDRLLLDDIRLEFTDRTREKGPFQATIKLDTLESSPLRSQWAMFDVLFRSRGRGSVNDIPFVVDSEKGKHFCRMNDVPIELLAHYAGPLEWFDEGKVDLLIEDTFDGNDVAMHWRLVFHDFHVKAPEGTPLKIKAAMLPLTGFLNLKSKRLPLEFELQVKENDFRFKSSTELNDVARLVLGDKIMDGLKKLKDKFKKDDREG